MKLRGVSRLRRAARRLRHRSAPEGIILLYHSIVDEVSSDPWSLCVTSRHFAEHLEVLRRHCCLMSLQQLTQNLKSGKLPERAVVITFDDGYANNLHNAKPLLERYDIPATVFLTSGYIGQEREFWWDELDRLLVQPDTLPAALRLVVNDKTYQWELGDLHSEAIYSHHPGWSTSRKNQPISRHSLYLSLYQILRPLLADERQEVLSQLLTWASAKRVSRPTHRSLTLKEVFALEQGGGIEVGAHTVTHPFLSALPAALQWDEIQRSKAYLEELVGHPVNSFAYPHGDYSVETVSLVREAGFACACSTVADSIWQHADCFQLPRIEVQNWNGEEFAKRLSRWCQ